MSRTRKTIPTMMHKSNVSRRRALAAKRVADLSYDEMVSAFNTPDTDYVESDVRDDDYMSYILSDYEEGFGW